MNTFKFRAWDKELKRMSRPFQLVDSVIKWNDGDIDMPLEFGISKNRLVIQQFTGLKDKNGVEVYSGDIVHAENAYPDMAGSNTGKVFFAGGAFMIDGDMFLQEHVYSHSPDILEDYVVIGNQFEYCQDKF